MTQKKSLPFVGVSFVLAIAIVGTWLFNSPSNGQISRNIDSRSANQENEARTEFEYARLVVSGENVTWAVGGTNLVPRQQTIAFTIRQLGGNRTSRANLANLLDVIGDNGWELVQVQESVWIFKRSG